jgi:hypothetical protein
MIATADRLVIRSASMAEAQDHIDTRECEHDHESARLGSGGWEVVFCDQCDLRRFT